MGEPAAFAGGEPLLPQREPDELGRAAGSQRFRLAASREHVLPQREPDEVEVALRQPDALLVSPRPQRGLDEVEVALGLSDVPPVLVQEQGVGAKWVAPAQGQLWELAQLRRRGASAAISRAHGGAFGEPCEFSRWHVT